MAAPPGPLANVIVFVFGALESRATIACRDALASAGAMTYTIPRLASLSASIGVARPHVIVIDAGHADALAAVREARRHGLQAVAFDPGIDMPSDLRAGFEDEGAFVVSDGGSEAVCADVVQLLIDVLGLPPRRGSW